MLLNAQAKGIGEAFLTKNFEELKGLGESTDTDLAIFNREMKQRTVFSTYTTDCLVDDWNKVKESGVEIAPKSEAVKQQVKQLKISLR